MRTIHGTRSRRHVRSDAHRRRSRAAGAATHSGITRLPPRARAAVGRRARDRRHGTERLSPRLHERRRGARSIRDADHLRRRHAGCDRCDLLRQARSARGHADAAAQDADRSHSRPAAAIDPASRHRPTKERHELGPRDRSRARERTPMTKPASVGITSYGTFIPRCRMGVEEPLRVWNNVFVELLKELLMVSERSVIMADQDTITMAVEAARQALARWGRHRDDLCALYV